MMELARGLRNKWQRFLTSLHTRKQRVRLELTARYNFQKLSLNGLFPSIFSHTFSSFLECHCHLGSNTENTSL